MNKQTEKLLTGDYLTDIGVLESALRAGKSFDMVSRHVLIGGREAAFLFIDGFVKDEVMEKILEYVMKLTPDDMQGIRTAEDFSRRFVTYVESGEEERLEAVCTGVLSGTVALVVDGFERAIMIDARTYPARGMAEPDDDRVLRGSRDGFVETLVHNTALIRRRLRDPRLTMEIFQIGAASKSDVVLCYLDGRADARLLERLRKKLRAVEVRALTMGQESLAECLAPRQWFNPFPKVRYTERPDCAAASVAEGRVLLLVDNSPSVMILPTSVFDFVQDTNDFYFPPLVGTYLRLVRDVVFLLTIFLTPVWFLLMQNPGWIPDWLDFIRIAEPNSVPLLAQLLVVEFIIDGIKLASLNTPGVLNNAFGIVGALILGDFAVSTGFFVSEVLLYMAFVAISSFTQPSFELGYAFKLFRILFLILSALFGVWGFAAGVAAMLLLIAFTETAAGKSYLYPLIPFRGKALLRLLIRRPVNWDNT
ncbi:MAG: spore germination protein [Clostridiales bacterium]|nr:spore germination protein [Clostridiales bacterium]